MSPGDRCEFRRYGGGGDGDFEWIPGTVTEDSDPGDDSRYSATGYVLDRPDSRGQVFCWHNHAPSRRDDIRRIPE